MRLRDQYITDLSARHVNGTSSNDSSHGAFQKYTVVPKHAVAELPYSITTSRGVVLPLGISTAAAGLYQKDFLNLPFPLEKPEKQDRTVIIWGGSSSVGSCAIQLAVASGLDVITTASSRNFDYVKKLGAREVYDYHDSDVEDQIVKALEGTTVVGGYHAVGADGAVQALARIVDRTKGKAIVVTVRGVPDDGIPKSVRAKASMLSLMAHHSPS
jgi:NADPH:quinone reductase-like Zn-dependent oxidoreductase